MIKNEKQYQTTCKKLEEFREAVLLLKNKMDMDLDLRNIQLGALQAQIEVLDGDLEEYLKLKKKQITQLEIKNLRELPEVMIKARIAKGLTQAELADKLNMKVQQIQRYELDNYESASFSRICEVLLALELDVMDIKVPIVKAQFLSNWDQKELVAGIQKIRQQCTLLPMTRQERQTA